MLILIGFLSLFSFAFPILVLISMALSPMAFGQGQLLTLISSSQDEEEEDEQNSKGEEITEPQEQTFLPNLNPFGSGSGEAGQIVGLSTVITNQTTGLQQYKHSTYPFTIQYPSMNNLH
jgi:hypothetical protein